MRRFSLCLFALLGPTAVCAQTNADSTRPVLAITHVTVIDATGAPAQADWTVVVRNGRILNVGKIAEIAIPVGAEIVDGTAKFLIPGLWDMHAHLAAANRTGAQKLLDLYLANGVTGIREMHAYFPDVIFALRKEIEAGKLSGPRIVAAGSMIDGPNPSADGALVAADARQGRSAVQALKKRGADFIKVHSKLPRDAYFAIADEANKQRLPFAGHVPESVTALEASDAGQKSIEHLTGLWISCSTNEDALRKETTAALRSAHAGDLALLIRLLFKPVDSYCEPKARTLYQRYVRNRT